jgi:osmotically-inducible protein OsmY
LLDETSIFVTVSNGRVVIDGSVENHEAKQRAETISRQASGIIGHDSNLAIRPSGRR